MRKIVFAICTIFGLFPFLISCSDEMEKMGEEIVQVSFRAELPASIATRTTSTVVDDVVCAVFENGEEIRSLRTTISLSESFSPCLLKGRNYQIVFWASKSGVYDVIDLTEIVPSNSGERLSGIDYDAFTHTLDFPCEWVIGQSISVTLNRPMSKINIGTTSKDYEVLKNAGMKKIELLISEVYTAYNALIQKPTDKGSVTYDFPILEDKQVGEYKMLSECYVFAEKEQVTVSYHIMDEVEKELCVGSVSVPAEANYNTNIVGSMPLQSNNN